MKKIIIECPNCHRINEVKVGFLVRKILHVIVGI